MRHKRPADYGKAGPSLHLLFQVSLVDVQNKSGVTNDNQIPAPRKTRLGSVARTRSELRIDIRHTMLKRDDDVAPSAMVPRHFFVPGMLSVKLHIQSFPTLPTDAQRYKRFSGILPTG